MGEAFLSKHTSAFKHRRDAALPKFCERDLFSSRPELFYRSFNCEHTFDVADLTGRRVFVIALNTGQVEVQLGGAVIGLVREGESAALWAVMAERPDCCGMLEAYVDDQTVMGDFTIRLPAESDEDRHD